MEESCCQRREGNHAAAGSSKREPAGSGKRETAKERRVREKAEAAAAEAAAREAEVAAEAEAAARKQARGLAVRVPALHTLGITAYLPRAQSRSVERGS